MTRTRFAVTGACLLALAMPSTLLAQPAADEAPPAKFIFGPLGLTPRIALKNLGVDTNPLNQSEPTARDWTATIEPGLDSFLRVGRGRLSGKTSLEYLYFNKSRSQRSVNVNQEGRAELALNRVHPYVFGAYLRTRQRPTPEIDLRVQQNTTNAGVGTAVGVGSRLRFDAEGRRSRFEFGDGRHGDQAVAEALNRDIRTASLTTRFTLTPLTTFVVRSEVQRDRFKFSTVRNSDSFSVVPGFELKPSALISGTILVGYRRFDALDTAVPDFAGVVGRIDAHYIMREATLFSVKADRNVDYSIESGRPYYVMSGGTLSVMQTVGLNWYLMGRVGEVRLAYRDFVELSPTETRRGRTDRVLNRGFGVGRRVGTDFRVGVDVDHVRRRSDVAVHRYQGFKVGGSITYGFQTR